MKTKNQNLLLGLLFFITPISLTAQGQISDSAMAQIVALEQEKASRSPVEQKLDSQFIFQLKQNRGQAVAAGVTHLKPDIALERDGRVLVDIDAAVTTNLLARIQQAGGTIINSFPQFHSIRAQVPLAQLETLAAAGDIKFIKRAAKAITNTGSVDSEGDVTHRADFARNNFGVNGQGVKVGVLSDSVDYLYASQASGDLGDVTVLPGQGGSGAGEGTAMLEIVHDLAPNAQLYFATAFNSEASFAQNILNLRSNGCDVIIDDVYYFDESPFQDGIIAQAVNSVTLSGALYFSAAGNDGNYKDGTSGTWEGDFVDSGQPLPAPLRNSGYGGKVHSFGVTNYDTVISSGQGLDLFWSDPLGASTNDYDLFELDPTGSYIDAVSANPQTGTQDPYEHLDYVNQNDRIVIVKSSGASRFLHLVSSRGKLHFSTGGATRGHSAAADSFSVAAVNAADAYPGAFTGGSANPVETFSSDGPRRVFYNADGSPLTPGNVSSTGGAVRQKPDIAAADGVQTYVWGVYTGYGPFFGTSAAAPHAGAIAALLLSYDHTLTPSQIRAALTHSALDIETPGFDSNSGAGIVMAEQALETLPPRPIIVAGGSALVNESCPNDAIDPGETVTVALSLTNIGIGASSNVVATLLNTGGVTFPSAAQSYGVLPAHGGTATKLFTYIATGDCGGTNLVTLQLQDGALNLGAVSFVFRLGVQRIPLSENFDSVTPPALPLGWSTASSGAGLPWQTTSNWNDTALDSGFIADPGTTSDKSLISPVFHIYSASAQLSFFQNGNIMAYGYSGGVLEISINGGPYQDIIAAGGSFVTNGYNNSIYSGYGNPLGDGRAVWDGIVGPTIINLPASAAGQDIRLRWRFATGSYSYGSPYGWYVDSIQITDGYSCCGTMPNNVVVDASGAPNPVVVSGNLTYTINIENTGPATATGVSLSDLLPPNFTLQSISYTTGVYPGPGPNDGGTVNFNVGTLAGGNTATITISGTANAVGLMTNRLTISRTDGGLITSSNAAVVTSVILPSLSISDLSVMEDATTAIFNVSLTPPPAISAFVRFATTNMTAFAGMNYSGTNGLLTFAPGVTNQTIAVHVVDDLIDAPDTTFAVNLSNPTNAVIAKSQGMGTIINVDPLPYLSVSDANVTRPNSGTTNATFNFSLSRPSGYNVSFYYSTSNGSAIGYSDYTPVNGYVTFLPGQTNLSINVPVMNHASVKPSQAFYMTISSPGYAKISRATGTGTIITVLPGQLDHFDWSTITSPQSNGVPFPVTVSARDYFENLTTNFSGAVGLSAWTGFSATNQPISFDDLPGSGDQVPPGYHGLTWSNIYCLSGIGYPNSGYMAGTVSPPNVAYNGYGDPASIESTGQVNLVSAYLTAAWNDNLQVLAQGYAGDTLVYNNTYTLSSTSPTLINFNYFGVTRVTFTSFGGTPNPAYGGGGTHFAMDNVVIQDRVTASVPIAPTNSDTFSNGVWTGKLTVTAQSPATNVVLVANDGAGHLGTSSPFDLVPAPGYVTHFIWSPIASPEPISNYFKATVMAQDYFNHTASNFTGSVSISASIALTVTRTNTMFGNTDYQYSYSHYGITVGQSFTPATNITVTGVRYYFGSKVSIWANDGTLLASTNVNSLPGTWGETALSTPLQLSAGQTYYISAFVPSDKNYDIYYRIDMSTNFTDGVINHAYYSLGDALPINNDSARWYLVDIRYTAGLTLTNIPVVVSPANSGAFTSGVWATSNMLINTFATNLTLLADDGVGHTGISNPFNVGYVGGYLDHFSWSAIASPQTNAVPFTATVTALDHFSGIASNFNGAATLSVAGTPNPSIMPASGSFNQGLWTGSITLMPAASNVVLRVADGLGRTNVSNPFNLVDPPLLPPLLQNVSLNAGALQFNFGAVPGHWYQLQYKTNLLQANWLNLGGPVNATNVNLWLSWPVGPDRQRFFRVQLQ
jgi:uncharacterized repeat protein (TIGR01451 family)